MKLEAVLAPDWLKDWVTNQEQPLIGLMNNQSGARCQLIDPFWLDKNSKVSALRSVPLEEVDLEEVEEEEAAGDTGTFSF